MYTLKVGLYIVHLQHCKKPLNPIDTGFEDRSDFLKPCGTVLVLYIKTILYVTIVHSASIHWQSKPESVK